HKGPISHLSLSPNGRFLASGSAEEKAWKLWDLNDRRDIAAFSVAKQFHPADPLVGPFSADGKYVLAQSETGVSLVEIATRKTTVTFSYPEHATAVALSADGRTIAMALAGLGLIRVCDVATRKELVAAGDGSHVYSVAFDPTGALLAVGRYNTEVHLLDATTLKSRAICKGHKEGASALAFSPDGKILASGAGDKIVKLWDTAT